MSYIASDVSDKVALVTGANSGLGFATSLALSKAGAKVIVACERDADRTVEAIKAAVPGAKVEAGPLLDLRYLDSIQKYADFVLKKYPQVHILVNNAGIGGKRTGEINGINIFAQVNMLGPYALTRMLEKRLAASQARVVTVASVYHRVPTIKDTKAFFTGSETSYKDTKLANVLFAFELQRRLGKFGVTSAAVDPGSVSTAIFNEGKVFKSPIGGLAKGLITTCWAPPAEGIATLLHAATVPWEKERKQVPGSQDLRYYARGGFAAPLVCQVSPQKNFVSDILWLTSTFNATFLDWPLRKASGGRLCSWIGPVKASEVAYDEDLAAKLWDTAADLSKLPRQPAIKQ